ncbi:hypothetical protein AHAS_Ahas11G0218100 [Arachis hypogaea]
MASSSSTFKLQFNLKLELKRVRPPGWLPPLPRLSSSLTLNWSLNVFDLQLCYDLGNCTIGKIPSGKCTGYRQVKTHNRVRSNPTRIG